jgi:hypothetical protein
LNKSEDLVNENENTVEKKNADKAYIRMISGKVAIECLDKKLIYLEQSSIFRENLLKKQILNGIVTQQLLE